MRWHALALVCIALPVQSQELTLPGATLAKSQIDPAGSVRLPLEPWSPGEAPNVAEGRIERTVLRIPNSARTTLQLVNALGDILEQDGFSTVFTCADAACGGFDFRFQLDILGEPEMFVDLGDYRYLVMRRDGAEPHTVSILASRSGSTGFVHVTTIASPESPEAELVPQPEADQTLRPQETTPAPDDLIAALTQSGHVVLPDLDFGTGSSNLGVGPFGSLEILATWLADTPTARIVLVGHSDSVGSLDANTALSRRRAESVARFLVTEFGADGGRIQAAGAGFLAPVASNLTEEGRAENRRVEAVLLSIE